jgi:hypothetical protein
MIIESDNHCCLSKVIIILDSRVHGRQRRARSTLLSAANASRITSCDARAQIVRIMLEGFAIGQARALRYPAL